MDWLRKTPNCGLEEICTFGFHTRTGKGPSSICFNRTGWGHDLLFRAVNSAKIIAEHSPLVHNNEKSADYSPGNGIRV